jgi:hypothetical protein
LFATLILLVDVICVIASTFSVCVFIVYQVFTIYFSFRDMALADAEKKLKDVMKKLDSVTSNFISEKESWEKNLANVEESWRCKMLNLFTLEISPFF